MDPVVQHFFNSTPMNELLSSKTIYQPGALRKVCTCACIFWLTVIIKANGSSDLADLHVHVNWHGMVNIHTLHPPCALDSLTDLVEPVNVYRALVSRDKKLVNVGDYICY